MLLLFLNQFTPASVILSQYLFIHFVALPAITFYSNSFGAKRTCCIIFLPCNETKLMDWWWLMQEMVDFLVDIWHDDEGFFD